ncbi:MAG: hypothetical protein A3D92_23240 [Bacteroidetes bacterium RIFCSPHIGHO2_02_FULL_44_7]|nr:MAG: hypothetical protein A3D92_23240 [Bacteroidetes bacterium RIFCSPHIGHO2_02_FULL_44_7]
MKRSQIILAVFFVLLTGSIYLALSANKKSYDKELKTENTTVYVPVREVENKLQSLSLISYGQVLPYAEITVSMEVQGKLLRGDLAMKPGTNFRTGQILYKVDNEEAFFALSSRKAQLSTLVLNAMPDIELDFPSERRKWMQFLDNLGPQNHLPELPSMTSKEKMFMTGRGVLTEYYSILSQEARLKKYFFAAPFSGTVIATYAEPGAIANPGAQLAKIAKTGDFEVKVPISMHDLTLYKEKSSADFTDASGKLVAHGKITRVSNVINQQTQSADVYYSISPVNKEQIYNGMHLNVSINQQSERETMTLPNAAVKNGKVYVLENGKLQSQGVLIVSKIPDSVYVTGLKNGQRVLLERVDKVDMKFTYEGIER